MTVDAKVFRSVMGRFATGVTIVTAQYGDELRGITVNSFTSVSLSPTLVLVCLKQDAGTLDIIKKANGYVVNILSDQQKHVSDRFAGKWNMADGHPMDDLEWYPATYSNGPIFKGGMGALDCTLEQEIVSGDHSILIGQVKDIIENSDETSPLVYYHGYCKVSPLE